MSWRAPASLGRLVSRMTSTPVRVLAWGAAVAVVRAVGACADEVEVAAPAWSERARRPARCSWAAWDEVG